MRHQWTIRIRIQQALKIEHGLPVLPLEKAQFTQLEGRHPRRVGRVIGQRPILKVSQGVIVGFIFLQGQANEELGSRLALMVRKQQRKTFELRDGTVVIAKVEQVQTKVIHRRISRSLLLCLGSPWCRSGPEQPYQETHYLESMAQRSTPHATSTHNLRLEPLTDTISATLAQHHGDDVGSGARTVRQDRGMRHAQHAVDPLTSVWRDDSRGGALSQLPLLAWRACWAIGVLFPKSASPAQGSSERGLGVGEDEQRGRPVKSAAQCPAEGLGVQRCEALVEDHEVGPCSSARAM